MDCVLMAAQEKVECSCSGKKRLKVPDCGVITKLWHLIYRFNMLIKCDTWVAEGEYQALEAFLLSL